VPGQASQAIAPAPDNTRADLAKSYYPAVWRRANEALGVASAGLAINPDFSPLWLPRIVAELSLGRFDEAKAHARFVMRLSPRDPYIGALHVSAPEE